MADTVVLGLCRPLRCCCWQQGFWHPADPCAHDKHKSHQGGCQPAAGCLHLYGWESNSPHGMHPSQQCCCSLFGTPMHRTAYCIMPVCHAAPNRHASCSCQPATNIQLQAPAHNIALSAMLYLPVCALHSVMAHFHLAWFSLLVVYASTHPTLPAPYLNTSGCCSTEGTTACRLNGPCTDNLNT